VEAVPALAKQSMSCQQCDSNIKYIRKPQSMAGQNNTNKQQGSNTNTITQYLQWSQQWHCYHLNTKQFGNVLHSFINHIWETSSWSNNVKTLWLMSTAGVLSMTTYEELLTIMMATQKINKSGWMDPK